ncbi:MAG: hypothetical protein U0840_12860 [Gemmataceae bacterium]
MLRWSLGADEQAEKRMDEEAWLRCEEPQRLLEAVKRRASERRLRLLASACIRLVWEKLDREECREALEELERAADGLSTPTDLARASQEAWEVSSDLDAASDEMGDGPDSAFLERQLAANAVANACSFRDAFPYAVRVTCVLYDVEQTAWYRAGGDEHEEEARQAMENIRRQVVARLRDLFGDHFRPGTLAPECLTPAVLELAKTAYAERSAPSGELDPVRLAILADALEEAGCSDGEILHHLRSGGTHVRGCWALDRVLGRE